jgi:hypothetical protein
MHSVPALSHNTRSDHPVTFRVSELPLHRQDLSCFVTASPAFIERSLSSQHVQPACLQLKASAFPDNDCACIKSGYTRCTCLHCRCGSVAAHAVNGSLQARGLSHRAQTLLLRRHPDHLDQPAPTGLMLDHVLMRAAIKHAHCMRLYARSS